MRARTNIYILRAVRCKENEASPKNTKEKRENEKEGN